MFPENPCVWVKDLAGYLNSKLLAPDTDPTLSNYAHGVSEMYSLYTECEVYWGVCKTSNLRIKVVVDVCGNCFAF